MTSTDLLPPLPASHNITTDAQPTRKRRRRTAGGGAQDDCFACRKRAVPCDRKRPYCTQCINIGKECTGYKTTLTWGVGVASRGKLRGLSLPVPGKQSAATNSSASDAAPHESKRRKSSASKTSRPHAAELHNGDGAQANLSRPAPIPIPAPQHRAPTSHPMTDMQSASWHAPTLYTAGSPSSFGPFDSPRNAALKHIQTSFSPRFDGLNNFPSSASSTGSFVDADYSPADYVNTPSSYTFPDHPQHSFAPFLDSPLAEPIPHTADTSLDLVERYDHNPFFDASNELSSTYDRSFEHLPEIDEEEVLIEDRLLPSIDTRFSNHLFHLPPRLQSLLNYYDSSICPFLVAFDTPQNPYRMHIIQLASHNEGLQNALAALATNNMRMRRKEHRLIGFVEGSSKDNEPSAEESHYKQLSIEQLNLQLTLPSAAQDDAVLATLLILCLFHVCDSGFSKFKTQLAGVQKLMSLRDPNTKSPFTGWVEMFFIWFDVMTAAVNDREPQIKGESLDMLDYSVNLGALEQFSGCDGRLFKLIARLGGLSLLAQGRVTSRSTPRTTPLSQESMFRAIKKQRPISKALQRSLNASDYEHLDGNGWGTPILSPDDEYPPFSSLPNDRSDFWKEWNDIRSRLQAWEIDTSTLPANPAAGYSVDSNSLTPEQNDLVHISESFRHSALLYTERLAWPLLPSSAPAFQHHVTQALYHITSLPVASCVNKFLLWPLFITGTECVDAGDRAVVRTRCIEIQRESGFYNNISCLEVLEKVWSDVDMGVGEEEEIHARRRDSEVLAGSESRQAFRWRRAMDRVDGEYLII